MSTENNCIICGMPVYEDGCYRHDAEEINEFAQQIIAEKTEELRRERARANAYRDEISRLRALMEGSMEYVEELIEYKEEVRHAVGAPDGDGDPSQIIVEMAQRDKARIDSEIAQCEKYLASVRAALGPVREGE